ncbi:hypothetical protein KP509_29G002700 [Ceratopteris richardii]|uniref:Uncharacterized protein n=1 Tax=Ceratopteris richardii TaxID=49495 RepID=A0A8T2R5T4_CERRI|nr:hypothetical protein KP509_29G002700 [Ceratopteris richardii]KAH7291152.1 hypothetical protein KP509_29G002700 [Ceratopteris richardii]KAH7291154.1 hypothetical protein KP509_29G002700 [Ceratopteris richardii]KAH7291155.1 hypothetical protein KP509_29G002700 [Ceratopteris richardii]
MSERVHPQITMAKISIDGQSQGEVVSNQARDEAENNLVSPDRKKREKAMSILSIWLTSQKEIKEEELAKIWKGLLYCLWHAEQELVHKDLVEKIAHITEQLDVEVCLLFFNVFLTTLRNEWQGIDIRIQGRFQLLLNQIISHIFGFLKKNHWNIDVVRKFMKALAERTFLAQDGAGGSEIAVSIARTFLHVLKPYLPINSGVFKVLLEPFWIALGKGCDDRLAEEINQRVFLMLFEHGNKFLSSDDELQDSNKEDSCFGDTALDLSFLIRIKSSALLAFASESNSAQLKAIGEKFTFLERMVTKSRVSSCAGSGDDANVARTESYAHINTEATDCSVRKFDTMLTSVSPALYAVTQTFCRRPKRNQKLTFSPQVVDNVYVKESLSSERTSTEEFPVHLENEQQNESGCTPLDARHRDLRDIKTERNPVNSDFVGINGSTPNNYAGDGDNDMLITSEGGIPLEDPVVSNLARRFESIAEQSPDCAFNVNPRILSPLAPSPINTGSRKRKSFGSPSAASALNSSSPFSAKENNSGFRGTIPGDGMFSSENVSVKKPKKVHFSLQHNIVWRPSTPLPPHDVRVPPAATPRGSALKKGLITGPVSVFGDVASVSPKKKKAPRKYVAAYVNNSPVVHKRSTKEVKTTRKSRLSPR